MPPPRSSVEHGHRRCPREAGATAGAGGTFLTVHTICRRFESFWTITKSVVSSAHMDAKPQIARQSVHIVRISLAEAQPEIWRRIALPSCFSLRKLHLAIQAVMPWTNSHLHLFEIDGTRYASPKSQDNPGVRDSITVDLQSVLPRPTMTARYVYDLGDEWIHDVLIEDIPRTEDKAFFPHCIAGERACPPEDCGGPSGFFDYLEASRVLGHPQRQEANDWRADFDPRRFDLADVNRRLAQTEWSLPRRT